jgi:phage shock protein A
MEAEADLVNFGTKPRLEGELDDLALDDEIEKELQRLKSSLAKEDRNTPAP